MTNYVEQKLSEIADTDFQTLVAELCECFNWSKDDFQNKSLANLFTAAVTERKTMDRQQVLIERIFTMKVKELALESVVHGVCCELARRKGKSMDGFVDKMIFTLIKECYKSVCPPLPRAQKATRKSLHRELQTELICRRRSNGSYF